MHRKFIAFVLSAAMAVTALTTGPVRADEEDIAKWIAGAAALAIIGAAIADANKDRKTPAYNYNQGYGHNNYGHDPKYGSSHSNYPKHKTLPRQCRVQSVRHGQPVRGFSARCLKRKHVDLRTMPRDCAVRVWDSATSRRDVVFQGQCLRRYGYQVAQRHY